MPASSANLADDAKLHGLGGGARVIVITFFGNVRTTLEKETRPDTKPLSFSIYSRFMVFLVLLITLANVTTSNALICVMSPLPSPHSTRASLTFAST